MFWLPSSLIQFRDKLEIGGPSGNLAARYQAPKPSRYRIYLPCGNLRTGTSGRPRAPYGEDLRPLPATTHPKHPARDPQPFVDVRLLSA